MDDDFEALWAIDQECFAPGIAYSRAELMHYVRRRNAFTIVAQYDQSIVGFVVSEMIRKRGHLITLDVLPQARRSRLGSRLMVAAEARLLRQGCVAVFLETAVDNAVAIQFYKKHNYVVLKTIPRYYEGKLDALVMGKKLGSDSRPGAAPDELK